MKHLLLPIAFGLTMFQPLFLALNRAVYTPEEPIKLLYPDHIYPIEIPVTESSIHKLITLASKKYAVSPLLIESVIKIESNFNPNAFKVEPHVAGASIGLMQVMSFNATSAPCHLKAVSELFNPSKNVDCGTALLREALNHTKRLEDALIAYNGGIGCLTSKTCRKQGTAHANKVMKILSKSIIQNSK